jgi:hypothetical protein
MVVSIISAFTYSQTSLIVHFVVQTVSVVT